ncbi:uncharacterized protein LOC143565219 [Bidens hawaiensis]|uniref:uncharacterized protein LOC143565219 n=1 Tax=Bidens hawaiensis TaxID=980011 RepID=UPI004049066A
MKSIKIHCSSFICFCNSGPLKLENAHHAPQLSVVTDPCDQNHVEESNNNIKDNEILEEGKQESQVEIVVLRSCMKNKEDSQSRSKTDRKKVQWVDDLGKELVDIREFESSETGDADNEDDNNACFCAIQ